MTSIGLNISIKKKNYRTRVKEENGAMIQARSTDFKDRDEGGCSSVCDCHSKKR